LQGSDDKITKILPTIKQDKMTDNHGGYYTN